MKARWSCGRCGAHGLTSIESRQVWHVCIPAKRGRRRVPMPEVEHITREEARASIWAGFAEALDARETSPRSPANTGRNTNQEGKSNE